jgi:uncharacterized membrane protein
VSANRRILALDAARGFAMLGVWISHFGLGLGNRDPAAVAALGATGLCASPTFILVSGTVLGYLTATAGRDNSGLRQRVIDRALFLLIVAHVLITVLHHRLIHNWSDVARVTFMTDTIGVSLLAGILVIRSTSGRRRLVFAGLLYLMSWTLVLGWSPSAAWLELLKETFVGSTDRVAMIQQNFPFIPWFAVFIAATLLGEAVARRSEEGTLGDLGSRLLLAGPVAIVGALGIKAVYWLARPVAWTTAAAMPPLWRDIYELTSPFGKYPPGPAYLLAYGGMGLILIGGTMLASQRGRAARTLQAAAVVGRASLFVFIAQYFVYLIILPLLPLPNRAVSAAAFVATISALWAAAWWWGLIDGNRFLTVGLRTWDERTSAPRAFSAG